MRRMRLWEIQTDLMLGRFPTAESLWDAIKDDIADLTKDVDDKQDGFDEMERDYVEMQDKADRLEEAIKVKCQEISESLKSMEWDEASMTFDEPRLIEAEHDNTVRQVEDIERSVKELLEEIDPDD